METLPDKVPEQDSLVVKEGLPDGVSAIHSRHDASEVWRLCCRIRLDMKENGLSMKDARDMLFMAYSDLRISPKDLKKFMEEYVDPAIIAGPDFWKKGLMQAKGKLNSVLEVVNVAQRMQDKWERMEARVGKPNGPTFREWMSAGRQVIEARRIQGEEQARVGFGVQKVDEAAAQQKAPVPNIQIHTENVQFSIADAAGGSFGRRRPPPVDVSPKPDPTAG